MDARRKKIDALIGQSLITAEALFAEIRQKIARDVSRNISTETTGEILGLVRELLTRFEKVSAQAMTDAELAGWLSGVITVDNRLGVKVRRLLERDQSPFAIFNEPVIKFPQLEDAAKKLADKTIFLKQDFQELEREAKQRAFTVAKVTSEQVIGRVRDMLHEQLEGGVSLRDFRKAIRENLATSHLGDAHVENIFRTNIQKAFHDGHDYLANNPFVREAFPYQEYLPIRDSRTRPEHLALEKLGLNGTGVYRRDDPFWDVWRPPSGYQ